jgi:hypothetical protein
MPDSFKAATRSKRSTKDMVANPSIHHLKSGRDILSSQKFNKAACTTSREGKSLISTYIAKNVDKIVLKKDIVIDIDSELHIEGCEHPGECAQDCTCISKYSVPIQCTFSRTSGLTDVQKLVNIVQRKGEAEMAQAD